MTNPLKHLYVIRKGAVRLERGGQTLQVLEEGETFGYTSLITGKATLDGVVEEDLLAYRIPGEEFHRLLSDARFAGHFAAGLATRLESSLEHSPVATFRVDLAAPVETLVRRAAVWVDAAATVGDAARVMVEQRVSSVLVRGETPGIVTDRDFRIRVLAQGLGPETPVARVLSRPVKTVEGSHAGARGLDRAARGQRPPPPGRARRAGPGRAHRHRPAQAHLAGAGGGAAARGQAARSRRACPATPARSPRWWRRCSPGG